MGLGVKSDMSSWFEIVLGPEGPYTSEPRLTGRPDGCQCTGRSSVYVYGMPDGSQKQTHGTCTANRESSIHSVCIREIMLDTDVIFFFGADLICKRTQARTLPYTPSSLAPPHTLQRRRRVPCGIRQTLQSHLLRLPDRYTKNLLTFDRFLLVDRRVLALRVASSDQHTVSVHCILKQRPVPS